jgi:hypothetical protein
MYSTCLYAFANDLQQQSSINETNKHIYTATIERLCNDESDVFNNERFVCCLFKMMSMFYLLFRCNKEKECETMTEQALQHEQLLNNVRSNEDGMSFVSNPYFQRLLHTRFPNDLRVFRHVRRMLDSSQAIRVDVKQVCLNVIAHISILISGRRMLAVMFAQMQIN